MIIILGIVNAMLQRRFTTVKTSSLFLFPRLQRIELVTIKGTIQSGIRKGITREGHPKADFSGDLAVH